jgi:hypothetical protein
VDESAKPCDDFYKFACGSYIKSHPTTEDHWVAEEIQQQLIRDRQISAFLLVTIKHNCLTFQK